METYNTGIKKRSFTRKLFLFMFGVLALVGISSIVSPWMEDQVTDNRIGVVEITGLIQDSQGIVNQIKKFREDERIKIGRAHV